MLYMAITASSNDAAEPAAPRPSRRKRRILLYLALGVAVLLAAGLCYWLLFARYVESTDDAYLQADSVTLAPKVTGYVREVLVRDNQRVNAGQPVVRLEDDQYQARLDQANAAILADQADIKRAEAEIIRQQAEIEEAQAKQRSALVQLHYAEHEYQRYLPLAASGAENQEKLTDLRRSRDQAQADYDANVAAVKSASAQIQTQQAQIDQSRAQLASARASRQQSHIDVRDTVIVSPIDGYVGDRAVRVGQFVQPGTRLLTVVPNDDIYLVANFKETQLANMRPGQPASLRVDAIPDHDFKGVVDSFAPGTGSLFALLPPDNATGNFTKIVQRVPVRIRITDHSPQVKRLLAGMSVTVDVDTHPASGQARP
ncbi:HlyD family secretion protein [Martelella alba]|uniref:HlyD family secretion protein n=1 Tax=Martelella alba TaxID=2590451 RepID=A0ABY2SG39_9HYPH|nr:HlyD family secretion protein [Martelella alba]TKI03356.1 HlyD family secretion protein [Martelella alba]